MVCIYGFSTDSFAASQTAAIIEPVIRIVFPNISRPTFSLLHVIIRKSAHLCEYALLSYLLLRALRQDRAQRWTLSWAMASLLISALYALSDEWHQSFTASRTGALADSGLDAVGGLLSQLYLGAYHSWKKYR